MTTENEKTELVELGANIERIRKEKKWRLNYLAGITEIEVRQLRRIEKGLVDLKTTTLLKLIWALEADPNEILPKSK
jgi:DNA-binding Xre family transcriptional regulator